MNDTDKLTADAIRLAAEWQDRAVELQTPLEAERHAKLARLLSRPLDKVIITELIDQSFRSADFRRVADQVHYVLTRFGIPGFLSMTEKALMTAFTSVGRYLPRYSVPAIVSGTTSLFKGNSITISSPGFNSLIRM